MSNDNVLLGLNNLFFHLFSFFREGFDLSMECYRLTASVQFFTGSYFVAVECSRRSSGSSVLERNSMNVSQAIKTFETEDTLE